MVMAARKSDVRTEAEELRMEVTALKTERHQLGLYLGWVSRVLYRAVLLERDDLGYEAAGRLDRLSGRLIRQGES